MALTLSPLTVYIDRFGVKNPPIFPQGYIVQVARIDAELSHTALLRRKVAGDLSFNLAGKNASFQTTARFGGINGTQLLATFPDGGGKMTGKMEATVKLGGEIEHSLLPLMGIRGSGHVTVSHGPVPSLKLNANLMKLAHFNDLGPAKNDPSSFNLITTDLELNNQRISSSVIDIDGYGVDVDGSGSVSVSGSDDLAYRGLAEITTKLGLLHQHHRRLPEPH